MLNIYVYVHSWNMYAYVCSRFFSVLTPTCTGLDFLGYFFFIKYEVGEKIDVFQLLIANESE